MHERQKEEREGVGEGGEKRERKIKGYKNKARL